MAKRQTSTMIAERMITRIIIKTLKDSNFVNNDEESKYDQV